MTGVNRLPSLVRQHIAAFRALLVFTVACGIIYPAIMFGVAQVAFHGSVTGAKGNPLPQYFQPRASNAVNADSKTDYGCDPGFSAASNLGPDNPTLTQDVNQRRAAIAKFDGVSPSSVPPDAVTSSASGLDPDISPQYAAIQAGRVAKARGLSDATVKALVTRYTQGRTIGILGEPRVDVLNLNIALDKLPNR